jgi:hypothetical protein
MTWAHEMTNKTNDIFIGACVQHLLWAGEIISNLLPGLALQMAGCLAVGAWFYFEFSNIMINCYLIDLDEVLYVVHHCILCLNFKYGNCVNGLSQSRSLAYIYISCFKTSVP